MKIVMVSMNSIHFQRWSEQLRGSDHEIHWFDVNGGQRNSSLDFVQQHVDWKYRFKKGRYFFKKVTATIPFLKPLFERNLQKVFKEKLEIIQPDAVHSFALYVSCTPILDIMRQSQIPWIYSSWGSDLFYYKDLPNYRKDIEEVLPEIAYLFTDCHRDQQLAKTLGFSGTSLGIFPGGGGFDLGRLENYRKPVEDRNIILVKGYQGRSGRAIPVLKAIKSIENELDDFEIVVFGCSPEVIQFQKDTDFNGIFYEKMAHDEVLQLMGKSLLYIGNSNSDGMPNTLLEAICLGAFPIQSNPGRVSEEVITHQVNGLLINDCENIQEITTLLKTVLHTKELITTAFEFNMKLKEKFAHNTIKTEVLECYESITNTPK